MGAYASDATESLCDNKEIIETNIRNVKISSPDVRYQQVTGWVSEIDV